jgi:hypothetical protein
MSRGTVGVGLTPSEQYLAQLCRSAFLSLWAYPNVFTDEGRKYAKGAGKELCDLLVVFGDQVIVFSDKHCEYKETGNYEVDWKRWYRKAVEKSVRQLIGAASFIKRFPSRLYLDADCQRQFPLPIENLERCSFHLVAVTRGSKEACERFFAHQSIGSLRYFGDIQGDQVPFAVGPIRTEHGLVHVFDENTLDIIFGELDTVADFVTYLTKRAALLSRESPIIWADGEEQLLALYLRNMRGGEHDFDIDLESEGKQLGAVYVSEGHWEGLHQHPQYLAKKKADEISYQWDWLVSKFIEIGDPGLVEMPGLEPTTNVEPAVREMASETRFARRVLADGLSNFAASLEPGKARARVMNSPSTPNRVYAILAEPFLSARYGSYEQYRRERLSKVAAYAIVARMKVPTARMAIGIAFDGPTVDKEGGSEDLFCHYVPEVTEEVLDDAARVQRELRILLPENVRNVGFHHQEFPEVSPKISRQQRRALDRAAKKEARKQR